MPENFRRAALIPTYSEQEVSFENSLLEIGFSPDGRAAIRAVMRVPNEAGTGWVEGVEERFELADTAPGGLAGLFRAGLWLARLPRADDPDPDAATVGALLAQLDPRLPGATVWEAGDMLHQAQQAGLLPGQEQEEPDGG